ncbi:efflux RND transporter periplasmic adaptor subunit [Hymenobacter sp. 5516J-16]|uniref:efflux RND transporter periplasmic adaptor subunit n=1 Tax=Hymenobacter sp. 5516J-16 TaxID=2932253 RepID=UPI001FD51484|nr:biotin/lipoyl-binding protein [Hymenobacter sp. 5516J-16]UOQ79003.1 efflux RND transporter periplasmic adaptor subunit [Hymenobacter sp. 5516J-16]
MKKILGVGLVLLVAAGSFLLPLWLTPVEAPGAGLPLLATSHFSAATSAGSPTYATAQAVRSATAGRVWEVYFHEGQRVRKGQLLLKLVEKLPSVTQQQLQARLAQQLRAYEVLQATHPASAALTAAETQLTDTRAQLARAVPMLSFVFVTAPADGVITGMAVTTGDYLTPQTVVAQLASGLIAADTTLLLSSVE